MGTQEGRASAHLTGLSSEQTRREAQLRRLRELQTWARSLPGYQEGNSVADELIEERREKAKRHNESGTAHDRT